MNIFFLFLYMYKYLGMNVRNLRCECYRLLCMGSNSDQ